MNLKIFWLIWLVRINVVIEYAYFEIPKGIYMFLTCQSRHMNFENRIIDLICANKCGYSVWVFEIRYDEIPKSIYMFSTCQSKHMNFENRMIDLICATKCGYSVWVFQMRYDEIPKVYICSWHVNQSRGISKIEWSTWFVVLNVFIEYAFLKKVYFFQNSPKYIYVLDMSIKAH